MKKLFFYIFIFLLLGSMGGFFTKAVIPVWYAALAKPAFTPPNYVFAPVWTVLYIMLAVFYWRADAMLNAKERAKVKLLFWAQFLLNLLWTPVFFGLRSIAGGLAVILCLDGFAALLLTAAFKYKTKSSALLVPYLLWLLFATLLNLQIFLLN